jgi:hypothetical protein
METMSTSQSKLGTQMTLGLETQPAEPPIFCDLTLRRTHDVGQLCAQVESPLFEVLTEHIHNDNTNVWS